jgi:hypothetical protein
MGLSTEFMKALYFEARRNGIKIHQSKGEAFVNYIHINFLPHRKHIIYLHIVK